MGLILAGGKSLRLFPVQTPKPLLKVGGKFLLQEAIERLDGFDVRIVTSGGIASEIRAQFLEAGISVPQFILEPEGRDTAAAVGFALKECRNLNAPWIAVLSADHWMPETSSFPKFLKKVEMSILRHPKSLFVAGSPKSKKTSKTHFQFGWITPGRKSTGDFSLPVTRFVEKPSAAKLKSLYKMRSLINCGMFFGTSQSFMKAYQDFYPDVLNSSVAYSSLPRLPIDRAIFEKADDVRVIPFDLRWEDLGTWADWHQHLPQKNKSWPKEVFVRTATLKEVHVFHLKDIAIVEDAGRLLVMPLSQTRNMKKCLVGGSQ